MYEKSNSKKDQLPHYFIYEALYSKKALEIKKRLKIYVNEPSMDQNAV
jgi:hypothetical protein